MIYHHIKYFPCKSILEISTHVCKTVTRREIAWYVTVHLGIISAIRGSSINSVFWNKKKIRSIRIFPRSCRFGRAELNFKQAPVSTCCLFCSCFYFASMFWLESIPRFHTYRDRGWLPFTNCKASPFPLVQIYLGSLVLFPLWHHHYGYLSGKRDSLNIIIWLSISMWELNVSFREQSFSNMNKIIRSTCVWNKTESKSFVGCQTLLCSEFTLRHITELLLILWWARSHT